jgi:cysteine desulfurase
LIYLDHHATTPLDSKALEAMLPLMREQFANAGSVTHEAGRQVAELVQQAVTELAFCLGASPEEIVITSGATESNNLALFGVCLHPRQTRRKVISVVSEHKALLDPLDRLERHGFRVELIPVLSKASTTPGHVDLQRLAEAIDHDTALVSVMLANNEIGVRQLLTEIAPLCRQVECLLHSDATQAVGRIPLDVDKLDVDLMSFSAHKFYGPKGVGGLFVRRRQRRVKLQAQIVGGGQQNNFRSGTLNSPGIVGMAAALRSCLAALPEDRERILHMRNYLFELLSRSEHTTLNGPPLGHTIEEASMRLEGNLNCSFFPFEGQSLMLAAPQLAISSGSACTSANPSPSHVLRAIGLTEEESRSSLRFGVGRFNTISEMERAANALLQAIDDLKRFT